jgi:hypothetical protein
LVAWRRLARREAGPVAANALNFDCGSRAAQLFADPREVRVAAPAAQFGEAPHSLVQLPDWHGLVGSLGEDAQELELAIGELHELACERFDRSAGRRRAGRALRRLGGQRGR